MYTLRPAFACSISAVTEGDIFPVTEGDIFRTMSPPDAVRSPVLPDYRETLGLEQRAERLDLAVGQRRHAVEELRAPVHEGVLVDRQRVEVDQLDAPAWVCRPG